MYQVETSTAVSIRPANPAPGTPGWFSAGNPGTGTPATKPGHQWFNRVQAEFKNAIEGAGLTLDPDDDAQLFQAIAALIAAGLSGIVVDQSVVKASGQTFDAGVADGNPVRWHAATSKWARAYADGTSNDYSVGFADVTNSEVTLFGKLRAGLLSGLTPGARYYLTAAGGISTVMADDAVFVGTAISATQLFVDFDAAIKLADASLRFTTNGLQANKPVLVVNSAQSVAAAQHGSMYISTANFTATLAQASTLWNGFFVEFNAAGGDITFTPNAADAINGGTNGAALTVPKGSSGIVSCTGAGWWINITAWPYFKEVIDETDIPCVGNANNDPTAGYYNFGAPFLMNVPNKGLITPFFVGRLTNVAVQGQRLIFCGLQIGTTPFFPKSVATGSTWGGTQTFYQANSTPYAYNESDVWTLNGGYGYLQYASAFMSIEAMGIPSGQQTVQPIVSIQCNATTTTNTLRGTQVPSRIYFELTPYV